MVDDVAAIGNWNCHNLQIKKIVFPNRLKDRSFSVDKPDEAKRRTRRGFFTLGRTKVGVKRRAGFGWSQPGFFNAGRL